MQNNNNIYNLVIFLACIALIFSVINNAKINRITKKNENSFNKELANYQLRVDSLSAKIIHNEREILSLYREKTILQQKDSLNKIYINRLRASNKIYSDSIKTLSAIKKHEFILNYIQ